MRLRNILFKIAVLIIVAGIITSLILTEIWSTAITVVGYIALILGLASGIDRFFPELIRPRLLRFLGIRNRKALILAAGQSIRWQASIKLNNDPTYKSIYWECINNRLESMNNNREEPLELLEKPTDRDFVLHKSLVSLDNFPIIHSAFYKYKKYEIINISVVVSKESLAQEEIYKNIDKWKSLYSLRINPVEIEGVSDTASSVYEGLKNIPRDDDVIISYSDIYWDDEILEQLINQKDGDVVVLVDKNWRQRNYPPRRVWHDELNAELVFGMEGKEDKINRVGEVIKRYENIQDYRSDHDLVNEFDDIFNDNRSSEILGLFKFSPKAHKVYLETFKKIRDSDNKIPIVAWPKPKTLSGIKPKTELSIEETMLSSFLEYLSEKNALDIRIIETSGKWVEIDHWGDLSIARQRFPRHQII